MNPRVPLMALAALLLCAYTACRRTSDAQHLAMVDSLIARTDRSMDHLQSLDLGHARLAEAAFKGRGGILHERLAADTFSTPEAVRLVNYHRTMRALLPALSADHDTMIAGLERTHDRLTALRHDVEAAVLHPDSEAAYLRAEASAVEEEAALVTHLSGRIAQVRATEERDGAVVDSLLNVSSALP